MRAGIVNSSWFAAAPAARMDARFWLSVLDAMKELGIDPASASLDDVKRAIAHNDAAKAKLLAAADEKKEKARALLSEAKGLEQEAERIRPK